jgi:hypothetical protein
MIKDEGTGPFTRYRLRKARCIRGQRLDRFTRALGLLIERGWIEPQPGKIKRYRATDEGRREYLLWGRRYLEFVRSTRIRRGLGERISSYFNVRLWNSATVMGIALENFG